MEKHRLIDGVRRYQKKKGLGDNEFARSINLGGGYYSLVMNRKRSVGMKFILAVAKIPELQMEVLQYLIKN